MDILTPDCWKRFRCEDGKKFDGLLFEELVEKILDVEFGGGWEPTLKTRDGGKDFFKYNGEYKWAEVKMMRRKLQLTIIANTLVMAIAEKVNTILFFSYSPLTKEACLHLGRFQDASSRNIYLFADATLERLLLRHPEEYSEFIDFPADAKAIPSLEPTVAARLTRDLDDRYDGRIEASYLRERKFESVSRGALLAFDILVQNHTINELKAELVLPYSLQTGGLKIENKEYSTQFGRDVSITYVLKPGQQILKRIYLRVFTSEPQVELKGAVVHFEGREAIPLPEYFLKVSTYYLPALTGKVVNRHVHSFERLITLRNKPFFAIIEGPSGSGKTRLKETFVEMACIRSYHSHFISAESVVDSKQDIFVRQIVSCIAKLPLLKTEQENMTSKLDSFVERVLYDDTYAISDHIEEIAEEAAALSVENRLFLACDDIQFLTITSVKFLSHFISIIRKLNSSFGIVLVFNTDSINLNEDAIGLLSQLETYVQNSPNQFDQYHLGNLDREDALQIIDNMIDVKNNHGTFSDIYKDTCSLILDKVIARPLHLIQSFKYYSDKGALGRAIDTLYVIDIDVFREVVQETPSKIKKLTELRWKLYENVSPTFNVIVQILCLFRDIPIPLLERIIRTNITSNESLRNDVHHLIDAGFLRFTPGEHVAFYHGQVAAYFFDLYLVTDVNVANSILANLQSRNDKDHYFEVELLCRARLGTLLDGDLGHYFSKINMLRYDFISRRYAFILLDALQKDSCHFSPAEKIRKSMELGDYSFGWEGFKGSNQVLQGVQYQLESHQDQILDQGELVANYFHRLANSFIGLGKDYEAHQVLEQARAYIQRAHFASETAYYRWASAVENRLCVTVRSLGSGRKSFTVGRQAIRLAEEIRDGDLIFRSYVDLANIFYKDRRKKDPAVFLWEQSLRAIDECGNKQGKDWLHANVVRARKLLVEGNFLESFERANDATSWCVEHRDIFHGIKGMYVQVSAAMSDSALLEKLEPKLIRLLETTQDWSARYSSNRMYWMSFYLLAKLHGYFGRTSLVHENYLKAYEQLTKSESMKGLNRHLYFWIDLVLFYREYDLKTSQIISDIQKRGRDFPALQRILEQPDQPIGVSGERNHISLVKSPLVGKLPLV